MFRCEKCGTAYSERAAATWDCCPRCLARDGVSVQLRYELGWRKTIHRQGSQHRSFNQGSSGTGGQVRA